MKLKPNLEPEHQQTIVKAPILTARTSPLWLWLVILMLGTIFTFSLFWQSNYYIAPWAGRIEQKGLSRERFLRPNASNETSYKTVDRVGGREADLKRQKGYRSSTY